METISGTVSAGASGSGLVSAGGTVSGKVKAVGASPAELIFSNRLEFPNVGREDRLYIAVDENTAYRFDPAQNIYVRLNDFDAVQCRLREE